MEENLKSERQRSRSLGTKK